MKITEPGQVWSADISYIPVCRGFLYLVAIIDLANRKVLSWHFCNTLEADFYVSDLQEAFARFHNPRIFITN